jgi:5-methylcytosine-specific restriction endonuclease McrA
MYGLEVARAMDLPLEFIEQAVQNRHRIVGSTLISTATTSIWNESIVRKECEICHNPITSELEVHHIQQRKDAHNSILKDGTHMNSASNLIVLCEKCHDKHHRNELEISTLITTSDGAERKTVKSTSSDNSTNYPEKSRKSKWTDDELDLIEKVLAEYKNSSLKSLKYHLESKYDISISEAVLGKIRRGEF